MYVCLPACLPACLSYIYIYTVWLSRWTLHRVSVLVALGGLHVHWQASYHCLKPGTEECHICMYIYIYEFLSKNTHIYMHAQACTSGCTARNMHTPLHILYMNMYLHLYLYLYIYINAYLTSCPCAHSSGIWT